MSHPNLNIKIRRTLPTLLLELGTSEMKNLVKRIIPSGVYTKIHYVLASLFEEKLKNRAKYPLTIAQGWENYAQGYKSQEGQYLGDEWNQPEIMGIDVPAEEVVSYLDEKVFTPFLGNCEVLLEIGSGGGRFTEILLPKCNKLIAADTSSTMIELLQKRFSPCDKINYLLLDGQGLNLIPDKSIDAAFSYGVFVHLQHWDIYNYLSELYRVLKPGGKVIIQHANTFSELGWESFLTEVSESLNRHKLPWTFTVMTPELMRKFTCKAGLDLEDCLTSVVRRDCISLITSPR